MRWNHPSRLGVVLAAAAFTFVAGNVAMAAEESKTDKILDKVSREANSAMRDVRFARVAIFDGQPEEAKKLLDSAKKDLAKTEKDAPKLVVTVKSQVKVGNETIAKHKATETSEFIPIDAQLVLSADFVPTPEKQAKIKEANEHLKKGASAKAVEILRAADIGVSVTRVLMPLKLTIAHVDGAIALLKDHKYYEANLALKGAQDGLVVDTVLLYEPLKPPQKK